MPGAFHFHGLVKEHDVTSRQDDGDEQVTRHRREFRLRRREGECCLRDEGPEAKLPLHKSLMGVGWPPAGGGIRFSSGFGHSSVLIIFMRRENHTSTNSKRAGSTLPGLS